ncbi:hypothetical protein [Neptunomonas antarctica]|uniref:Transmembrane anchor protein n=1 Tax=Neptunomonas antarctica TaxID=619304 RepID=A0A1N7KVL7_9GAMM|nr:hypothetical protein [Neptunomonas antarctica]SIS65682.1 hypothetical protein SAMN05421760_10314 [Neptunomonas antarctica]
MTQPEHTGSAQHELEHTVQPTRTLIKASAFAVVFGAIVLTIAILPAEYGIDPTGVGAALGLTKLANAAPIKPVQQAAVGSSGKFQMHSTEITVPAGEGLEYKFSALKGDVILYAWQSGNSELFFDFHGEPKGDTTGYFQSYTVSTSNKVRGSLTAPFEGSHGWYWENKGSVPVTVSLKIQGNYEIIGIK